MGALPKIPGYRIEKKLAEGGMATVYLGIQEKLNRKVAIKILDPSLLKNKIIEIRFLQEAETAANMYHSNIISIFDIGRVDNLNYIVMEYLKETLKEYILGSSGYKLKPEIAFSILKPIILALDYAHSLGIIHRDIKTENIMFRQDSTPVLTDFGIARALDSDKEMTKTGMSLGTPYYMSPEQCRAEGLDGRSDFYSLGVVLFEILTGTKPYDADSPMAVALKHLQEPVPQLPNYLQVYQPLIDKMMAKRREDRVSGGEELIVLIEEISRKAKELTQTGQLRSEHKKESSQEAQPRPSTVPPENSTTPNRKPPTATPLIKTVPMRVPTSLSKPVPDTLPESLSESESNKTTLFNPGFLPGSTMEDVNFPRSGIQNQFDQELNTEKKNDFKTIPAGLIITTPVSVPAVMIPRKNTFLQKFSLEKIPLKKGIEIGVLMILLITIFIIFFNLGSDSKQSKQKLTSDQTNSLPIKNSVTNTVNSTQFSQEFLQQGDQYRADYNHVLTLIENKDFEKAGEWVEKLKKIKSLPEIMVLEETIKKGIQETRESAYYTYYNNARKYLQQQNFKKAKENVQLAKQLNDTPEIQALEKRILNTSSKYNEKMAQRTQKEKELIENDNQAFALASGRNTIEAYRLYIKEFPGGRHLPEAINQLNTLEEAQRLKNEAERKATISKIKLRRSYKKEISLPEVSTMMIRNKFFDKEFNKDGNFRNKYEKNTIGGDTVIMDTAADLVWYAGTPPKEMNFKKAEKWIKGLNAKRYGGYTNWRLPSVEEAASLLRKSVNIQGLHIDPTFSDNLKSIWTGDGQRTQTYWVIRFFDGTVYADSEFTNRHVRPVRSVL